LCHSTHLELELHPPARMTTIEIYGPGSAEAPEPDQEETMEVDTQPDRHLNENDEMIADEEIDTGVDMNTVDLETLKLKANAEYDTWDDFVDAVDEFQRKTCIKLTIITSKKLKQMNAKRKSSAPVQKESNPSDDDDTSQTNGAGGSESQQPVFGAK